ncbi:hypothetical protein LshimejAT787_0202840 [Lyophyllum shimeji]|uniref:Uncharacterized protein n=1 Tax=Lyophyllum shimeji TaxID=47721 RepID=A0A9P3UHZ9_LYOSH|nr:hypothetical protein LshimejAT787_0202840 [Lyophyllum shimeji]
MVKSPKRPPPRQSTRPTCAAAPLSAEEDGAKPQVEGDVTLILKELHDRQARKASARSMAFQAQKKAIYAAARKTGQEISRSGIAYLEKVRAEIQELNAQEVSHEQFISDFQRLCVAQEESIESVLSEFPPLLDELAPRRANQANTASEMLRKNPARRELALKTFCKNARAHVEEARENERVATDASALIKHYKNLLCN